MKEIEIKMVLSVPDNKTIEEINDLFIEWVEDNGWSCGGSVNDISDVDRYCNCTNPI